MNLIEFTNILKRPGTVSINQTRDLTNILEEFPYFQAAHFLYLNGLKNQNSFKYNNSLKKTAAYTTDRNILFDHITSFNFNFVNEHKKDDFHNIEMTDYETITETKGDDDVAQSKETLVIGKPFEFNSSENHSFNEWLQLTSIEPIVREGEKSSTAQIGNEKIKNPIISSTKNFNLIEKFIASNPKLKPSKSDNNNDISIDSIIENENLMTETLAHVYLEQKKYKKAITAFTVLSLKYPEKSSFFANQIQAIKKLQDK